MTFCRIPVAHRRAARRARRGGRIVPAGAVRRASAPASGGSISRSPPDGQLSSSQVRPVTPGFFRTLGIPQVAGRDFADCRHARLAARGDRQRGARAAAVPGWQPARPPASRQRRSCQRPRRCGVDDRRRRRQYPVVTGWPGPPDHLHSENAASRARHHASFVRTDQDPMLLATGVTAVVPRWNRKRRCGVRTLEEVDRRRQSRDRGRSRCCSACSRWSRSCSRRSASTA